MDWIPGLTGLESPQLIFPPGPLMNGAVEKATISYG